MSNPERRAQDLLEQVAGTGVRVAELLCDRHDPQAVAFTVVEEDLTRRELTYGRLRERSERAAAALSGLGVGPGDRVATLMGKGEELVVTLLGIWRLGAIHIPLFTAFATSAIAQRLIPSAPAVVVCDASQRSKLEAPELTGPDAAWTVVTSDDGSGEPVVEPALPELLEAQSTGFPVAERSGDDHLVHIYTSGTTGSPKAVPVPVRALAAFGIYLEYGLDVREDDVFWNAADPGWAYGLYYGILAPLFAGRANILLRGRFDPAATWRVLAELGVTNLAAAPTMYRTLRSSQGPAQPLSLRVASSAGEPLNPQLVTWAEQTLGTEIRDDYGQTEMGMCIVNGWHPDVQRPIESGSMGRPLPGFAAEVIDLADDDPAGTDEPGRLAIVRPDSPLMWFPGYVDDPARTAERYTADGRLYLTGDVARRTPSGAFAFSSRDDDVILMAGYRIGPLEVESAMMGHPAVAAAAAIGVPDEMRGEVVEAYVVLRDDAERTEGLEHEIAQVVKTEYAAHAYPRRVHIVDELPTTASGKIQRNVLRDRHRGQAPADEPG
ncbi:AMP-binding protein [Kocuria palustris]|uniref:AMP-binding protein n=1 Tax=Kocuria palustris TaxID=71999 RepID=UPI0011A2BA94|nr:AMP-binding protein [Kocuria palustris]